MSAGGISYSGLVNHGKITLPSVETWGNNMNILKDPPKSLFTRKIDKVGETSSLTESIDQSSNRTCEAVQVYARGVNPFTSVSYTNQGNNGGQRSGGITSGINPGQSAKLPYTIMRDGSFRPPIQRQEQLLPLSRLPRNVTHATTTPGFVDFSKKMRTCGTAIQTKEVKNKIIYTNVKPTASYKLDKPIVEPFHLIKQSTQPIMNISACSGVKTLDITDQHVGTPTKEINMDNLHVDAKANVSQNKHINNNHLETDRYLQDVYYKKVLSLPVSNQVDLPTQLLETDRFLQDAYQLNVDSKQTSNQVDLPKQLLETDRFLQDNPLGFNVESKQSTQKYCGPTQTLETDRFVQEVNTSNVSSKQSSNLHHTSIEDVLDLSDLPIHNNVMLLEAEAAHSGHEKNNYIHDDIELSRTMPEYQATTNLGDSKIFKRIEAENEIVKERNIPVTEFKTNHIAKGNSDHGSRQAYLAEKIKPGGFCNSGIIPNKDRVNHGITNSRSGVSDKLKINQLANEAMMAKFSQQAPFK